MACGALVRAMGAVQGASVPRQVAAVVKRQSARVAAVSLLAEMVPGVPSPTANIHVLVANGALRVSFPVRAHRHVTGPLYLFFRQRLWQTRIGLDFNFYFQVFY